MFLRRRKLVKIFWMFRFTQYKKKSKPTRLCIALSILWTAIIRADTFLSYTIVLPYHLENTYGAIQSSIYNKSHTSLAVIRSKFSYWAAYQNYMQYWFTTTGRYVLHVCLKERRNLRRTIFFVINITNFNFVYFFLIWKHWYRLSEK